MSYNFNFAGEITNSDLGLQVVSHSLNFNLTNDGISVFSEKIEDACLSIEKISSGYKICYREKPHFFRAIGLLIENINCDTLKITEKVHFNSNGIMVDMSQGNAAMNLPSIFDMLTKMATMGLNRFYLYMEDNFEVSGEPYFGYMRPRYSNAELKEIDDFAYALGIEVIPCIQTLAHLIDALKWDVYKDFREDDDTLLVGHPRTYDFIENIIKSISSSLRTNIIHIGMDEAWKLGQGEYLKKNGYKPTYEIMNEHLKQVLMITKKYHISPMIWSDMFIKATNTKNDYYHSSPCMPDEVIASVPRDLTCVYWDYNHHSEETYENLISQHRKMTDQLIFAGGIWNWSSFTVDYDKTFLTSIPAIKACKKAGIRDIFATTWGDGTTECNIFSVLLGMQLYAEYTFSDDVTEATLKRRFRTCTGCNYSDFRAMTYVDNLFDHIPEEGFCYTNASKILMWQDILSGLFDKDFETLNMTEHYEKVYNSLIDAPKQNGEYGFIFEFLLLVTYVLRLKSDLGKRIKLAYDNNRKDTLGTILNNDLPEIKKRVITLHHYHRKIWLKTYKALGMEIIDLRYGALLARIDTAMLRLSDFLSGTVDHLEELDQKRLHFYGEPRNSFCLLYSKIYSASRNSFCTSF